MEPIKEVKAFTKEIYTTSRFPETDIFVDYFKKRFKKELLAVIFYGSCLSAETRSSTSFHDFYLIADQYNLFHKRRIHSWINSILPPAIFYLELMDEQGEKHSCKYCVISIEDLEKSTSHRAKDLYHLGRFSKRIAILYSQGIWVTDRVVDVAANAWQVLAPYAIVAGSSKIDVRDFAKTLLSLSYKGELRLEKPEEKIQGLYLAEKSFYDKVLGLILQMYAKSNRDQFKVDDKLAKGVYLLRRTPAQRAQEYKKLAKMIRVSQRRAKARWPLMMFTIKNWVDILLSKLERTYGTKLELSPFERRFILIFGWRHYFRLKKEGKVK